MRSVRVRPPCGSQQIDPREADGGAYPAIEQFVCGIAAHELFCIGSDFPSANRLGTDGKENSSLFILPSLQKIASRRGTRPRLRIEEEGAAAPSCIPGEHMPVFCQAERSEAACFIPLFLRFRYNKVRFILAQPAESAGLLLVLELW